ncbi:hypothetical protein ACLFMI_16705 [Pseudonocardia nantongensis]|uniref:RraA family protein n=1 Tax=Pseudonocardia nantongensis TaxID=1181885 RepID=UPI00397D98E0
MSRCRIVTPPPAPKPELLARLAAQPTPALSDAMDRLHGAVGLRPIPGTLGNTRLVGPALTVRTRPGDNLVVHKAVDLARPGDVVVVDGAGDETRALVGDLLCRHAAARGVAGLVVDGAVRDVRDLASLALPVFARSVSHLGPYKDGPGEIGAPISIGGTALRAGDVVVGDDDGVVAVPCDRAGEIAGAAEELSDHEREITAAIAGGMWDRSWVDAGLEIIRVEEDR